MIFYFCHAFIYTFIRFAFVAGEKDRVIHALRRGKREKLKIFGRIRFGVWTDTQSVTYIENQFAYEATDRRARPLLKASCQVANT